MIRHAAFTNLMTRLWANVLDKLGGMDATFAPLTGEPITLKVMFTETMLMQPDGQTQTWVQEKSIAYSIADLPREAIVGETFSIDGTVYEVCAISENDGYVIKAVVHER